MCKIHSQHIYTIVQAIEKNSNAFFSKADKFLLPNHLCSRRVCRLIHYTLPTFWQYYCLNESYCMGLFFDQCNLDVLAPKWAFLCRSIDRASKSSRAHLDSTPAIVYFTMAFSTQPQTRLSVWFISNSQIAAKQMHKGILVIEYPNHFSNSSS